MRDAAIQGIDGVARTEAPMANRHHRRDAALRGLCADDRPFHAFGGPMSVKLINDVRLRRPTVVLFDLDNTLYDFDSCHRPALAESLRQLSAIFKLDYTVIQRAYETARKDVKSQLG